MTEFTTLAPETIHNPAEPRHFMALKPIKARVAIRRGGALLAESDNALRLIEIGRGVYQPTIYLPRGDVSAQLVQRDERTHCPLKGDAVYFDADGAVKIAWSYPEPPDFAADLAGRVAFYPNRVEVTETPQDA